MTALTLKGTLKMLEGKGFRLSKRTFEYYQSLGLLPKPEKKVGAKGRGLYGFYNSETILKAVGFIFTLKEKGVPLDKIKEEADKSVINQYVNHLKRWGFSDYSLPEMKSSYVLSSELLGNIYLPNRLPNPREKVGAGGMRRVVPFSEILGGKQELTKEERTFFESELIAKAKWWETDKIEAMALEHINEEAKSVLEGMLVVEQFFQDWGQIIKTDSTEFKQIMKIVENRLRDNYLLMSKVIKRLAEINGGISVEKSTRFLKRLSERFGKK